MTATQSEFVASMGFCSCSVGYLSSSTITANNATLYTANSSVTATGSQYYGATASFGFASSTGSSTIIANNATHYAANSTVTAKGSYSVASMGFTLCSSSTITADNVMLPRRE